MRKRMDISSKLFSVKSIHSNIYSGEREGFNNIAAQFQTFGQSLFLFGFPFAQNVIYLSSFCKSIAYPKAETVVICSLQCILNILQTVVAAVASFGFYANGSEGQI